MRQNGKSNILDYEHQHIYRTREVECMTKYSNPSIKEAKVNLKIHDGVQAPKELLFFFELYIICSNRNSTWKSKQQDLVPNQNIESA